MHHKKNKHGGYRKGSGRKKKYEYKTACINVSLPTNVIKKLNDESLKRKITRSELILELFLGG